MDFSSKDLSHDYLNLYLIVRGAANEIRARRPQSEFTHSIWDTFLVSLLELGFFAPRCIMWCQLCL